MLRIIKIIVNTIQIFLLLIICSCNSKQEKKIESNEADLAIRPIEINSTAFEFPDIEIPNNFYLDSISFYDTLSRAKYDAYFLQSNLPEKKIFNQAMQKAIKEQIRIEQTFVEPYTEDSQIEVVYLYQLRPTEIFSFNDIISICNIIDTYTEGGNHHNYTWYSFNYDFYINKTIEINDVFNLKSKIDSTEFIDFAEQYILNDGCTEWGWPYEYLDFSLTENGIYINPNLSWACIHTRSLLPVDADNKFINENWVNRELPPTRNMQ